MVHTIWSIWLIVEVVDCSLCMKCCEITFQWHWIYLFDWNWRLEKRDLIRSCQRQPYLRVHKAHILLRILLSIRYMVEVVAHSLCVKYCRKRFQGHSTHLFDWNWRLKKGEPAVHQRQPHLQVSIISKFIKYSMLHTVYGRGCRSFFVCEVLWDEISRAIDSSKLKTEEWWANMIMPKAPKFTSW